jgi:NADH dehydrogenase
MKQRVLVFGGRGFIGTRIVQLLGEEDYDVLTVDRRAGPANHIQANILSKESVTDAILEGDTVINLVGLSPLRKPKGASYEDIHVNGAKNVVEACKGKCRRLLHMSALGADPSSKNEYIRTKGEGEELVLGSGLSVNVFCPSVIYDINNELIQMFLRNSRRRLFPRIPAMLQPVFRDDISALYALGVQGKVAEARMEVGGPERLSIFAMARIVYNQLGRTCIPIPFFTVKTGMSIAAAVHLFGVGQDQIGSLTRDNITDEKTAESYIEMTRFTDWVRENIELS